MPALCDIPAVKSAEQEIMAIKAELGEELLVLGHHYQRSSVLKYADRAGDSLELARFAGANGTAGRIVFCGVRFMAESADILTSPEQAVYMPDMLAGCPMAQMANAASMRAARDFLRGAGDDWLPVVYVNSTAEIKAVCGEWGGSTCTSSNAVRVFKWVFDQGKKVFFLPDEHLGWNTGHDLGVDDSEIGIYDMRLDNGGLTVRDIASAKVLVWKGFCIVHQAFSLDGIKRIRREIPGAKIIVHPEAPKEIVRACDAHGSTAQIIKYVEEATDGSTVVIGTEINLVERLADQHKGRVNVLALAPAVCTNMAKTNEQNLLKLLKDFPVASVVSVPEDIAGNARSALERMLSI